MILITSESGQNRAIAHRNSQQLCEHAQDPSQENQQPGEGRWAQSPNPKWEVIAFDSY